MARVISPIVPEDIAEVSAFLVRAFHTPADAEFAAPDAMRWKCFEPRGDREAPRGLVAREGKTLVAYGGMTHGWFHVAGRAQPAASVMHGIDWASPPEERNIGARLMMRGHSYAQTQYALNYSDAARRVIEAAGYELRSVVPVYQRVLRPSFAMRIEGQPLWRRGARVVRDSARSIRYPAHKPSEPVTLRTVETFGPEVDAVLAGCTLKVIFTSRGPSWLNHALAYPRRKLTGSLVEAQGRVRGFGLLNVVPREGYRLGKIVECFLDTAAPGLWHAAVFALTQELSAQGADVAEGFASTPWMTEALRACGFYATHTVNFLLRDRHNFLPRDLPFHLTPFEADYAYT